MLLLMWFVAASAGAALTPACDCTPPLSQAGSGACWVTLRRFERTCYPAQASFASATAPSAGTSAPGMLTREAAASAHAAHRRSEGTEGLYGGRKRPSVGRFLSLLTLQYRT